MVKKQAIHISDTVNEIYADLVAVNKEIRDESDETKLAELLGKEESLQEKLTKACEAFDSQIDKMADEAEKLRIENEIDKDRKDKHDSKDTDDPERLKLRKAKDKEVDEATAIFREMCIVDDSPEGFSEASYEEGFWGYVRHNQRDSQPFAVLNPEWGKEAQRRQKIAEHSDSFALGSGTDTKGGHTVPVRELARLIETLDYYTWFNIKVPGGLQSPRRQKFNPYVLRTSDGRQIELPTMDDTAQEGSLIAEATRVSEQDPAFGKFVINAYKYTSGRVLISHELLRDSMIDIATLLRNIFARRIGRIFNKHATVGTGTNQPAGVVPKASKGIETASPTAITVDEVMDVIYELSEHYLDSPSVGYMAHKNIIKYVRQLKNTQGDYIWQPANLRAGEPSTLFDYPVVRNNHMDSTVATSKVTMLFGDFAQFWVRLIGAPRFRRSDELYLEYDQAVMLMFWAFDCDLPIPSAIKKITQA